MGILGFLGGKTALEKANELFNRNRLSDAIPHLVRAIELNQEPALTAAKLGTCYHHTGAWADAERAFFLAVRLNPANVQAWIMCSLAQTLQGKCADARVTARQGLGYAVAKNQELDCHLAILQSAAVETERVGYHRGPGARQSPEYRIELDTFRSARAKVLDEAKPVLARCLELAPENPNVHRFHALIAIYNAVPDEWTPHMAALQRLDFNLFQQLKEEFRRCYGREMPMAASSPNTDTQDSFRIALLSIITAEAERVGKKTEGIRKLYELGVKTGDDYDAAFGASVCYLLALDTMRKACAGRKPFVDVIVDGLTVLFTFEENPLRLNGIREMNPSEHQLRMIQAAITGFCADLDAKIVNGLGDSAYAEWSKRITMRR